MKDLQVPVFAALTSNALEARQPQEDTFLDRDRRRLRGPVWFLEAKLRSRLQY